MWRDRTLKVLLVLFGLVFLAFVYPLALSVLHPDKASEADAMMISIYVALGAFLLLAARNPSRHRSLIAFAGWANLAHAAVMALMAIGLASDRSGLLIAAAIFAPIGISLLALRPRVESVGQAKAVAAQTKRYLRQSTRVDVC
ncbi:MAG TPA: DUF6632 domain-containing protein [Terriglobales bacterium]|nr:DUF6632 domain-containing protein [Terriglobales bacterium]